MLTVCWYYISHLVENAEYEEEIDCEFYGDNPTSHAIPFLWDKLMLMM